EIDFGVTRLRFKSDQVIKEAIKLIGNIATELSGQLNEFSGVVGTKLDSLKDVVVNSLAYFLKPY
ncbi:hypothetical protein HAX54_024030, partial [Datura stramonium]|nr:hypothetical protein [Datura stramonium]